MPRSNGLYHRRVNAYRRQIIQEALEVAGSKSRAALHLGIPRQSLQKMMLSLGLRVPAAPTRQRSLEDRQKDFCRSSVATGLRLGILSRPDHCSSCLKLCFVQAHHPDYSKPFEVVWLCGRCHKKCHP